MGNDYQFFFELEVNYDNSDTMTDYFDRHARLERYILAPMPGKRVTEKKLRTILRDLPPFVRGFEYDYVKANSGSMCWPGYGTLEQKGRIGDLSVDTYRGGSSGLWFTLSVMTGREIELSTNIPTSIRDIETLVNARAERRKIDRLEANSNVAKSRRTVSRIKQIMTATAIFDGKGLETQTPETRVRRILELDEVQQAIKIHGVDWSKEIFKL